MINKIMMAFIFMFGFGCVVTACSMKSNAVELESRNARIEEFVSKDGTYCIVASMSGHAIAMQCRFDNSKLYQAPPA